MRGTLTTADYNSIMDIIESGDVIVTRTNHRITNWLIPGHFKHCLMYTGHKACIEAVLPVLKYTELVEVVERVDELLVLRAKDMTEDEICHAATNMRAMVGLKYDLDFEPDNKTFYCSEAVWVAFRDAVPHWGFTERERLGVQTVTPEDFALATKYFRVVWSK